MRLFFKGKDGGPESKVHGYWLIESKRLFSVALLRFDNGSREAFHTHAFNSVSWLLTGRLHEIFRRGDESVLYLPSWRPIVTKRATFHRVISCATSWVLTFRGPWSDKWREYLPRENRELTLTHGRVEVDQ